MWSTGINRNIVECKDFHRIRQFRIILRINRNIVECKVDPWGTFEIDGGSINRNIVECKAISKMADNPVSVVLIETLWNVKKITAHTNCEQVIPY